MNAANGIGSEVLRPSLIDTGRPGLLRFAVVFEDGIAGVGARWRQQIDTIDWMMVNMVGFRI